MIENTNSIACVASTLANDLMFLKTIEVAWKKSAVAITPEDSATRKVAITVLLLGVPLTTKLIPASNSQVGVVQINIPQIRSIPLVLGAIIMT